MKSIQLFIRLSRPIYLVITGLLYFLGGGIAHYLSGQLNGSTFALGFVWVILLILGFQFLTDYFDFDPSPADPPWWRTPFSGDSGALGIDKLPRPVALWAGLTCVTIIASLTVILYQSQALNLTTIIFFVILLLAELAFALPPFRLASSGYGELVISIIRVGTIPALAFALQHIELHRLLVMVSFPLITLHLGMLIALELPVYASDTKYERKSVTIRIGWQKAMLLHNLLVLGGFVLFGIAFVLGLPLAVGWSIFLILPIAIFQIWMMNRIAEGARPNWNLVALVAIAIFCLTTYLLSFAFWTH